MDVEPQDEGMFVDLLFKNPVGWLMISLGITPSFKYWDILEMIKI